jgi:hypothetical protein
MYRTPDADRTVGTFVGIRRLNATDIAQLGDALSGVGQPGACQLQRDFAVIGQSGGPWVNVELGGCWRVVRDDLQPERIGRADPTTAGRLLI